LAADEHAEYDDPDDQLSQFDALFNRPSLSEIYGLGPDGLEAFAQYVFECAGYAVKHVGKHAYPFGPGVDLDLYHGPVTGTPVLRVEVRCYSPDPPAKLIDADAVMAFIGKLQLAGNVPGVMVTTSDYTGPAQVAGMQGHVTFLDGKRFLRYITYLHGSRLTGAHAPLAKNFKLPPIPPSCLLDAESTPRLDPKKCMVLAVANNKGGVAKTTSAVVLAQLLATKHQQNVLVIDMDGQASLTRQRYPALGLSRPRVRRKTPYISRTSSRGAGPSCPWSASRASIGCGWCRPTSGSWCSIAAGRAGQTMSCSSCAPFTIRLLLHPMAASSTGSSWTRHPPNRSTHARRSRPATVW
jgi:hypothetical protein